LEYNEAHGITPQTVRRAVQDRPNAQTSEMHAEPPVAAVRESESLLNPIRTARIDNRAW
jgi:excinuclease UvrABC helicase subunit UvrB